MQNCYAGDIGDFVKYALLRAVMPGRRLGVVWYLYPDEDGSADRRHLAYLNRAGQWRFLDSDVYDALRTMVRAGRQSVGAIQAAGLMPGAAFADQGLLIADVPVRQRASWRRRWFERVYGRVAECDLIFADPDDGISPVRRFRPTVKASAKTISLGEAEALAKGRALIVHHRNTSRHGGHRDEIRYWQRELPGEVYAYYWRRWVNRTFFFVNADDSMVARLAEFAECWGERNGTLVAPLEEGARAGWDAGGT